jgi:hypothetical protein
MKKTYLVELLRPSYRLWTEVYHFDRYRYGPYSDDVFGHIDVLVFHGLVRVDHFAAEEGRTVAAYAVTPRGAEVANRLAGNRDGALLASLAHDVVWALQSLGFRTAQDLCRLVYEEPYFAAVLKEAQARGSPAADRVPLDDVHSAVHPSFRLQAILKQFEKRVSDGSPRQLVREYLSYLALGLPAEGS